MNNTTYGSGANHRQRVSALITTGDIYAAIDDLLRANNRHGPARRCKGRPYLTPTGPALTYCDRWQCWRCGPVVLDHERRRMVAGTKQLADTGAPVWFVNLYAADTHTPLTVSAWSDRLGTLLAAWRKKNRRDGHNLTYCAVTALKPTTGQPHTHILADRLIAPVAAPTRHRAERYLDAWLADCADRLGMVVHVERATEPVAVARYMVGNLASMLDRDDLPALLRRVTYSQSWPVQSTRRRGAGRHVGLSSTTHTNAAIDSQTPPPTRANDTTAATREVQYMAHTHDHARDGDGTDTRVCTRCGNELPATAEYWQRAGGGRWRAECKRCTHILDNIRDTRRSRRLDRRLQRAKNSANRRAAARGVAGVLTVADLMAALEAANGVCHHCKLPLHDGWHVDHKTPFARGGTNTPDNLCVSCPTCNLSKGTLTPVAWWHKFADRYGMRHTDAPTDFEIAVPVPLPLHFVDGAGAERRYAGGLRDGAVIAL